MPDVIFARPRYDYDSYRDLYRLIALSGYRLIYFDEIETQSDNTYVLTIVNGENNGGYPGAKARIILYDLEWRLDGDYPRLPGVSEVWAADVWYAEKISARYIPLGSHPELALTPPNGGGKPYDVAMLSYMTGRRQEVLVDLIDHDVRVAPNGWGTDRDCVLRSTKIMLHVHQNENAHTVAPQRFALAAAYGMPLISETLWERGVFTPDHVLTADKENILTLVKDWRDHPRLVDYAAALHQLLCWEIPFHKCIEAAI